MTKEQVESELPLTEERLKTMHPLDLVRIEPATVPTELQGVFVVVLGQLKYLDEAMLALSEFARLGEADSPFPEHLRAPWSKMFEFATEAWRVDVARELIQMFPDVEQVTGKAIPPAIQFLLTGHDLAKAMAELATLTEKLLEPGNLEELQRLIWMLLGSPYYKGLGILLARGVIPIVGEDNAAGLFEGILAARAKLNLSPEDEFTGWMNDHALRRAQKQETAAVQEAHDKLAAKMNESRADKEELARLKRELSLRERKERREETKVAPPPDAEAAEERRRLKAKIASAKAREAERGEEVLTLRRELDKALQALETTAPAAQREEREESDSFIEVDGNQPVRLVDFPKDFGETLTAIPRHVGRAVMNRVGRLASGEPAAFDRIKQLKGYPAVLRARVSDKYRLLFCLEPDRVRIVDLIRRADLDRRIERLQASGLPPVG